MDVSRIGRAPVECVLFIFDFFGESDLEKYLVPIDEFSSNKDLSEYLELNNEFLGSDVNEKLDTFYGNIKTEEDCKGMCEGRVGEFGQWIKFKFEGVRIPEDMVIVNFVHTGWVP